MSFNLSALTTALVSACATVDAAISAADSPANEYARQCGKHVLGGSISIDDMENALIAACMSAATKAQRKNISTVGTLSRNGFATAYSRFASFKRIAAAERLPDLQVKEGKRFKYTLVTLARECQAIQPKAPRKAPAKGKGKSAAKGETLTVTAPAAPTWQDVAAFMVHARKSMTGAQLADHMKQLSVIVAESGNCVRKVEAYRKAQAKAKLLTGKAPAKAKAKARKAA